jgi:hypothetical protein
MDSLLLVLSPFVVQLLTAVFKKLPPVTAISYGWRTAALRFLVAVLSFGAATGSSWLAGADVDPMAFETFANALFVFGTATASHFITKGY